MAYPWSSGDVLTASDLNAYAGLVPVKSQAIGSGVSSVTLTNAFSSTFENYRVIVYVDSASGNQGLGVQFGSITSGYYGSMRYDRYDGGLTDWVRSNNAGNLHIGLTETSSRTYCSLDILQPNAAEPTAINGGYYGRGYAGWFAGVEVTATQHTSFVIVGISCTLTGGSIRVYGYNNG